MRKWGIIAVGLMIAGGVFGQESPQPQSGPPARTISANEAVDLAIKNNLSLQSSLVTVDTKKRKSDLHWNQFIPSVDAQATLAHPNKVTIGVAPYSQEVDPSKTWAVQTSIAASITISFAMFEGIRNFRLDYQGGLLSYDKAKVQTERDVRKAYYNMQLLQENIKLKKEGYAAAERQESTARANYNAGLSPQLVWLQAQVAKENLKPELAELENSFTMLKANFALTLGIPYDTPIELDAPQNDSVDFIPLDVQELISQAVQKKPDLLEIKHNILFLESARKGRALQLHTPYINLAWNYGPGLNDAFHTNWFKSDSWADSGRFSVTVGINLNSFVSIFKEGQELKDMDNNLKSLNIGLAQAVRGTELEVYNIILSLQKTQTSAEAMKKTADLAQTSYNATYRAYSAGLQDYLQVQSAQDQLNQAKLGILAQNFTYLLGLIDLEYAIGVPFGTLSGGNRE